MSDAQSYNGRFVWFDLNTSDPEGAKAFYTTVAGWGTEVWDGMAEPYTMWTVGGKSIGGVMPLQAEAVAQGTPPHWLGYIGTPDVEATVAQATSLGATVYVPPMPIPTVGKFAVLADPFGAVFAVFTPEAEAPGLDGEMPVPGQMSWFELATKDLNGALDFYGKLFGWGLNSDMDMGPMGTYRIFERNGAMMGGMYVIPESMPMPPSWLFYIHVDDINAAAERAKSAGGNIVQDVMDVPGGKIFMATDPQGAMFAGHAMNPM